MIGESPTRPYRFISVPPVDVPAARFPALSRATAPTVPKWFSSPGSAVVFPLSALALAASNPRHRRSDCIEPAATALQALVSGTQRNRKSVDVRLSHPRRHAGREDRSRTAVDHHYVGGCGCCLCLNGSRETERQQERAGT